VREPFPHYHAGVPTAPAKEVDMSELIELDVRTYKHLQRRLARLQSYNELPDDAVAIQEAEANLASFLAEAIEFHGEEAWADAVRSG